MVDGNGLENRRAAKRTESSNLSLSAKKKQRSSNRCFLYAKSSQAQYRKCYTENNMQPRNQGDYQRERDEPRSFSDSAGIQHGELYTQSPGSVAWQASEYVHHEKQAMWFVPVILAALVLLIVSILVVQSLTFAVLIIAMTAVFAIYAVRPPRIMSYELTTAGLKINEKFFAYHDFRYFGIIQDGPLFSVVLIPNKRFMPAVNVYFPEENGGVIVDTLGTHLPMEKVQQDSLDKLMKHLRF